MKDDWKKLIYEDLDFDGKITDYDILENDANLQQAMEKNDTPSSYFENDYDEYEDEDDSVFFDVSDEEEYEDDETSISLSFSLTESERTTPTIGAWKYYDERWNSWEFVQALKDQFPELARQYKTDNSLLAKIICDTYEMSSQKAFEYLTWLWSFFPASMLNEQEKEYDNPSYLCRAYLVWYLIVNGEDSNELLDFVTQKSTITAVFHESIFEEHELITVKSYLEYLFNRKKFDDAIKVYNAFKEGQVGKYAERDLADLWDDMFVLDLNNIPVPMKIYNFLKAEINSLLPYSKRAVKNFARVHVK